jgi:hypothetical protein
MPRPPELYRLSHSLLQILRGRYASDPPVLPAVNFKIISTGELASANLVTPEPAVTLCLHGISSQSLLRNAQVGQEPPLGLELHYLLTIWSQDPEIEQTLIGWAAAELWDLPKLPALPPPGMVEGISEVTASLIPEQLTPEDLARIWMASRHAYRLSYPFMMRLIQARIEQSPSDSNAPRNPMATPSAAASPTVQI